MTQSYVMAMEPAAVVTMVFVNVTEDSLGIVATLPVLEVVVAKEPVELMEYASAIIG